MEPLSGHVVRQHYPMPYFVGRSSALQERVSLIITTNLPFGEWVQVLGDQRLAGGLLDRLTFQSHILEFRGESFRFRHGLEQQRTSAAPESKRQEQSDDLTATDA